MREPCAMVLPLTRMKAFIQLCFRNVCLNVNYRV